MVAPPFGESGGPEVATINLAEALARAGVDVTLFAPGDWKVKVKHVPTLPKSIWNMSKEEKADIEELKIASQLAVVGYANNFDIVHFHSKHYAHFAAKKINKPAVLTMHNNFSDAYFSEVRAAGFYTVAVSKAQARGRKVDAIINHGLPLEDIEPCYKAGKDLVFIGRLTDQKGIEEAIAIARKAGRKLHIFGRIGNTSERRQYFEECIKPHIDQEKIIYHGAVSHSEIYGFLKRSGALLFPIRRPEVFGLVAAEALACGVPVIGTKTAPLPELLTSSNVCFLSDDLNELVAAASNLEKFERRSCRRYAEDNFNSSIMAQNYIQLYRDILSRRL